MKSPCNKLYFFILTLIISNLNLIKSFFTQNCINFKCLGTTALQNGNCIVNDPATGNLLIAKCPKNTFCNALTFASSSSSSSGQKCVAFTDFFDAKINSENPDGTKTAFVPVNYYCQKNSDCISNNCQNSYCVGIGAGSPCKNTDNLIPGCDLSYYCSSANICVNKKSFGATCTKDYECPNTGGCFNSSCTEYYSLGINSSFPSITLDNCMGNDCGPYSTCLNKKCLKAANIGGNCLSTSCPFFAKCNSSAVCEKSFEPVNYAFPNSYCESNFSILNSNGNYNCVDLKITNKPATGGKTCTNADTTSCQYNYNVSGFNLNYFFTCGCDLKNKSYSCQDGTNDDTETNQILKSRNSIIKQLLALCPRNFPFCRNIIDIDLYQKDVYKYINSGITPIYSDSTSDLGLQMLIGNLIVYEVCDFKPEEITGVTNPVATTPITNTVPVSTIPVTKPIINTTTVIDTKINVGSLSTLSSYSSTTLSMIEKDLSSLIDKYTNDPNLLLAQGKEGEITNIINNLYSYIGILFF